MKTVSFGIDMSQSSINRRFSITRKTRNVRPCGMAPFRMPLIAGTTGTKHGFKTRWGGRVISYEKRRHNLAA